MQILRKYASFEEIVFQAVSFPLHQILFQYCTNIVQKLYKYFANVVEILYEYCGGKLFAGTVPANKKLFAGTVPAKTIICLDCTIK